MLWIAAVRCSVWPVLALFALSALSAGAQVHERGSALAWVRGDGAEDCVTQDALQAEIRARLGRDPFRLPPEQRIEATVSREHGLWVARLYEHDPSGRRIGSRVLSSASTDCRELEAAVTLAIALIIDPEARADTLPPTASLPQGVAPAEPPSTDTPAPPAEGLSRPPQAGRPHAADRVPAPARSRRASWPLATIPRPRAASTRSACPPAEPLDRTSVRLGAALVARLQPTWGPVFTLDARGRVAPHTSVELGAFYAPESRTTRSGSDHAVGLTALRASGCYSSGQRISAFACAGALAGAIHSVVFRPTPTEPGDRAWLALGADAGVELELGPLLADFRGLLWVPLSRWSFEVGGTQVFEQAWVLPGAAVSVGTRFW
jgi:hypothetical protein